MTTPSQKWYANNKQVQLARNAKCRCKRMHRTLEEYYNSMPYDPERPPIEFMQKIIKVKCNNQR